VADEQHDADATTIEIETDRAAVVPSDTVGTGSYVAVSCSVMMILATLFLIAGLLIARWLS